MQTRGHAVCTPATAGMAEQSGTNEKEILPVILNSCNKESIQSLALQSSEGGCDGSS